MQESEKKVLYSQIIDLITTTKAVIEFAFQIASSIKSDHIEKEVLIESESGDYYIKCDWIKNQSELPNFIRILTVNTVGYQILILRESYHALVKHKSRILKFAEQSKNPDLWAAQEILHHIRNALAHMCADEKDLHAKAKWDFTKTTCPGKLEIASIGVSLDTTNLQDVVFTWNEIGGIQNFIKVLDFLREDLLRRIALE